MPSAVRLRRWSNCYQSAGEKAVDKFSYVLTNTDLVLSIVLKSLALAASLAVLVRMIFTWWRKLHTLDRSGDDL